MQLDSKRVQERMGKCFTPECEGDPIWFAYSWWRYCDEHVPERKPKMDKTEVYIWHTFKDKEPDFSGLWPSDFAQEPTKEEKLDKKLDRERRRHANSYLPRVQKRY